MAEEEERKAKRKSLRVEGLIASWKTQLEEKEAILKVGWGNGRVCGVCVCICTYMCMYVFWGRECGARATLTHTHTHTPTHTRKHTPKESHTHPYCRPRTPLGSSTSHRTQAARPRLTPQHLRRPPPAQQTAKVRTAITVSLRVARLLLVFFLTKDL